MNYSKSYFRLLVSFLILQIILSEKISEQIEPKCTKNKIKYTILADMMKYTEHENNIDGRELYSSIDDLKTKKIGTFSIFTIDSSFQNVTKYKNYNDLLYDLRKHKLDGILVDSSTANYTQSFINDLSLIKGNVRIISPAFVFPKDSIIFKQKIEFYENFMDDILIYLL